jgi:hypothetical protein
MDIDAGLFIGMLGHGKGRCGVSPRAKRVKRGIRDASMACC